MASLQVPFCLLLILSTLTRPAALNASRDFSHLRAIARGIFPCSEMELELANFVPHAPITDTHSCLTMGQGNDYWIGKKQHIVFYSATLKESLTP